MLQVYSTNVEAGANAAVPFNNVYRKKGCTASLAGSGTIELSRCGVYMVAVNGTAEASTTLQLYVDGVAQEPAQTTGTTLSFITLVQVPKNDSCCPCASGTSLKLINTTATTMDVNCVVTKVV